MSVAIGSDHRGLALKLEVIRLLSQSGHSYHDFGTYDEKRVDYPDIAQKVAGAVARGEFDRGILICGTGIGMSMAANKVRGIRAALCCDAFMSERARQHNDANVLCLGAEEPGKIDEIVPIFLNTAFDGGRHQRRVDKIKTMEGASPSI